MGDERDASGRGSATVAGLRLTVQPAAAAGSLLLWGGLVLIGVGALDLSVGRAIVLAVAGVILHWFSALVHHLGHAWAAGRTGHPMSGIRFGILGVLAASVYPADEAAVPAAVHVRRALGGPIASALLTIVAGLVLVAVELRDAGAWRWLAWFFFLDNLFVFTLQVFLPLGFNDGSTLARWRRGREA